jgi:poly(3-hydroxybutyrate) depolymerase
MQPIRVAFVALSAALIVDAQPQARPVALADQPGLQALSAAVRGQRRSATVSDEVKAQVDKLLADANSLPSTEARRRMANAWSLLNGKAWDPKQEFAWSLAVRADRIVADSSLPFVAHISQLYSQRAPAGVRVRASLAGTARSHDFGVFPLPARDLIEQPAGFDGDVSALPDGQYRLRVELLDGDASFGTLEQPVQIVQGIEAQYPAIERRLAKIQGHDGTKGSVRYPYQLARTVNAGRRQFSTADFGIPWNPQQPPYDFAAGMKSSADLLKALEAGKDPLLRAKGDHQRHYWFEEAGEPMPYRVYVPTKWDGKSRLPMVLVLHGNTRDHDYYFDRDENILAKLAEKHGYLVATPMGYRPSAGWGSMTARPGADPARVRQSELSEKDTLHVLDRVTREYNVDASRIYLFGHSAGGAGTWHLGQKYPEKWAAIAASAAATRADGFPFERLKGMPVMVCHGAKDDEVPVTTSRNMVKAMKERGQEPVYLELPEATHGTVVALVEPKVFEFFDRHARKQ